MNGVGIDELLLAKRGADRVCSNPCIEPNAIEVSFTKTVALSSAKASKEPKMLMLTT